MPKVDLVELYENIPDNQWITASFLEKRMHKNWFAAREYLQRLMDKGMVKSQTVMTGNGKLTLQYMKVIPKIGK